jgi:hypothetical protein
MSLFDDIPVNSKDFPILSASRMTDMPAFYPDELIKEVDIRIKKYSNIHTLVLWTKHPGSLLKEPLYSFLKELKKRKIQLYCHLTITGMGKIIVGKTSEAKYFIPEPGVPTFNEALSSVPEVVKLCESPERIRIRIDPIVRIIDFYGKYYSNINILEKIISTAKESGIVKYNFSLLEPGVYKKTDKRFEKVGVKIINSNKEDRLKLKKYLHSLEEKYSVRIFSCAVSDFSVSRCVDGEELSKLHDQKVPADMSIPRTRELCGCTKSIDLGGWPVKKCFSGCIYCYASPEIKSTTQI